MVTQQGFFVKIRDAFYTGPYDDLRTARNEAREKGPTLEIYHGVLKKINDQIIDDSQLFLVPKCQK